MVEVFDRGSVLLLHRHHQSKVVVEIGVARIDFPGELIVIPRELIITGIEVEIGQIVVRLEMPGLQTQGSRETIKSLGLVSRTGFQDAQVAECICRIVAFRQSLTVFIGYSRIVAIVEQQGKFKSA